MTRTDAYLMVWTLLLWLVSADLQAAEFNLRDFQPVADGKTDDTPALRRCFAAAEQAGGGTVIIPAGNYLLPGNEPISLCSHLTVSAYGARFQLPKQLPNQGRVVLFAGQDVQNLNWFGGHFAGHCFDSARTENVWEPHANTRAILITTTAKGKTENLTFRDLSSKDVAGAVITVLGASPPGSEREVQTYARNVTLESCTLERSGKFMWDYGLLWQYTVWPEDYSPVEQQLATKYFRNDLIRGPLRMEANSDQIVFKNVPPLPITKVRPGPEADRGHDAVCFYGNKLPTNVIRGKQYFVVESTPEFIRVAETPGGAAIRFASAAGDDTKLIADLFSAYLALYAPQGSGPGKGAFDLVGCHGVNVRGCRLSALGDTMHIQKSVDVIFANNHITGSRMGAFFLAEYCRNATITGNTVDGTNGSRVISIEKSCQDVTMVGNTFRNGGRGSWINQPRNLVLQGNLFVNNTTKCEADPRRGRRSFLTGEYERYAEMYFTTHEVNGKYGNVLIQNNLFVSGDTASHALTFAPGGDSIIVSGNLFRGKVRTLPLASDVEIVVKENLGLIQVPSHD